MGSLRSKEELPNKCGLEKNGNRDDFPQKCLEIFELTQRKGKRLNMILDIANLYFLHDLRLLSLWQRSHFHGNQTS